MPPQRTVLIDTDTASDDAVALIMALRSPYVCVAAITVVAGNVPVEQATRNALVTVELCGAEVPVYTGAAKPLCRELETATWFHGMDGLGDCGYAPSHRKAESMHAVDAIIATALANPGLEVITLGPLTNLALAIAREPRIVASISRCVVMGGAPCCEGNVTPAAEFNIWVDPEAARIVMLSGLPVELVGWQLSRYDAVLNAHDIDLVLAIGTPLAEFAIRCNGRAREAYFEQTGEHGISLPDPVAMALLLEPGLALEASDHFVEIETASPLTRGMTVVDKLDATGDTRNAPVWADARARSRKANVVWKLNVPGWKRLLMATLTA
ncbi:nucleoside hydrolase [Granulicella sp. 5B5]|uniref:nucleoside hydrolase n=1 Tax=Granulicella sp. 5B5 TaxID=1617967 RepID=UPI0015F3A41C|nr:nucleoside hydrolase [Granulicella sp. 5B5]QMV18851.1 nucleoside hydrolase [Granulicella sp. 5B5]